MDSYSYMDYLLHDLNNILKPLYIPIMYFCFYFISAIIIIILLYLSTLVKLNISINTPYLYPIYIIFNRLQKGGGSNWTVFFCISVTLF